VVLRVPQQVDKAVEGASPGVTSRGFVQLEDLIIWQRRQPRVNMVLHSSEVVQHVLLGRGLARLRVPFAQTVARSHASLVI